MSMEVNNHVIDLLPDYILDALTDEEASRVIEHLSICPSCKEELLRLQQVADDLPLALSQATPPAALKGKLLDEIRARQKKTAAAYLPTFWQRLMLFLRQSAPAWSLALVVVLAIGNLLLVNRINQLSNQSDTPMQVIALAHTDASPQAVGTLIVNQKGDYGTLVVDKLAALAASQQYQVWLIQDGKRTSGGVFSVNTDGYASLEILAPQSLVQYDSIGITIEPFGGSPGPTGAKVMGGEIKNQ